MATITDTGILSVNGTTTVNGATCGPTIRSLVSSLILLALLARTPRCRVPRDSVAWHTTLPFPLILHRHRNWWGCTKESYTPSHCASTQGDHCRRQPDDRRQQSGGDSRSDSGGNSRSDIRSDSGSDGAAHQAKGASCEDCEPLVIAASQMHASDLDERGFCAGRR